MYHFLWDQVAIRPVVRWMVRTRFIANDKFDKMRESLWKNAAVGTFFLLGLYIGHDKDWFMNPTGYFTEFPYESPEILKWYYMIYLAFWFQGIDFMLSLTSKQYTVKRKDNAEMLLHHFATISLMLFSYYFDLTRIGMCVLMIHDVNDLLLESAKVFVYSDNETVANILFGTFAVVWFIVRWGFYSHNILYSVYTHAWNEIVQLSIEKGSYLGVMPSTWIRLWFIFFGFLLLLLVLHIYWGILIVKMVAKALSDGNVEKDIRSDSEGEDDEKDERDEQDEGSASDSAPVSNGKPKRRRAPKAE